MHRVEGWAQDTELRPSRRMNAFLTDFSHLTVQPNRPPHVHPLTLPFCHQVLETAALTRLSCLVLDFQPLEPLAKQTSVLYK
jgi:hypothetical protein